MTGEQSGKLWNAWPQTVEAAMPPHTHTYTHTHTCIEKLFELLIWNVSRVKMRMKEDGGEAKMKMTWKLLNKEPERGNATKERRNQEKTPTPTHLARSGQTLKRQGKRKTEADGRTDPDPRRGGRTEAPEQTYTSENKAYLSTQGPNLPGERSTHEIRDQWGLVGKI